NDVNFVQTEAAHFAPTESAAPAAGAAAPTAAAPVAAAEATAAAAVVVISEITFPITIKISRHNFPLSNFPACSAGWATRPPVRLSTRAFHSQGAPTGSRMILDARPTKGGATNARSTLRCPLRRRPRREQRQQQQRVRRTTRQNCRRHHRRVLRFPSQGVCSPCGCGVL
ncbi:MAG: hypothetical protein QOE47_1522, partial [Pyrinomonadaceae bacterium]|nr:hypothetical protein [Pyrinomonadaceae bacterium]